MGLFSNKNNQLVASEDLKIVKDCVKIINRTKNPSIFFERYDLMEQKLNILIRLSGVRYTGTPPRKMLSQVQKQKQAAIHKMIERYFADISLKAVNLKTAKAKRYKYKTFISSLEPYFFRMDNTNMDYIKYLYESSINKLADK